MSVHLFANQLHDYVVVKSVEGPFLHREIVVCRNSAGAGTCWGTIVVMDPETPPTVHQWKSNAGFLYLYHEVAEFLPRVCRADFMSFVEDNMKELLQ